MAVSVSLKKLAEILGLAPSTVSRALKGYSGKGEGFGTGIAL